MAENRIKRDSETRETTTRKRSWQRPEVLPSPEPQDGYEFRWVRVSTQGQTDATNVSSKLREGWEPVKAEDHPEILSDRSERFESNITQGGGSLGWREPERQESISHYIILYHTVLILSYTISYYSIV